VGLHLAVLLLFFASTRLRLPLVFFLTPFAAFAVREGVRQWLWGRRHRLVVAVALLAVAAGMVSVFSTRAAPRDLVRLSAVLSRQERNDEALRVLRPALFGDDADPVALDQAGWIHDQSGELFQARDRYRAALDAGLEGSRAVQCRTRLAMTLERLSEFAAARAEHDAAVAGKGANAWNYYERGMFRLRNGDPIGGKEDIVKANRLNPQWSPAREALESLP
jgi:tetratricopeptide (TPR) repeat protein